LHSLQPFDPEHNPSTAELERDAGPTTGMHSGEARVTELLEALPREMLEHARMFHEQVQYFINFRRSDSQRRRTDVLEQMPEKLKRLLSDITDTDTIGEQIKNEIWLHEHVRKVCGGGFFYLLSGH
jgi:hypothetical protein